MRRVLLGVKIYGINKVPDERGFFAELLREDWRDLLHEDRMLQINLSASYPGIVRAWHRHTRGQVDYVVVLKGAMRICAYDDRENSETRGQLDEIIASAEKLQVVRIPGFYWHGTKTVGNEQSLSLYIMTKLYDYNHPDEDRRPWNDPTIIDPGTKLPYDWNRRPHR